ncbi:hypothetical protein DPEC_G00367340 [Dallia pectoralis]|nr:hypothetical protein DPEC_G00367340 [Dallia pectoralis]
MVNTVRTRDTPQPRLEERRQMVSTQTMTEDEPPASAPEVRNYKQTIMVELPRDPHRWSAMSVLPVVAPESLKSTPLTFDLSSAPWVPGMSCPSDCSSCAGVVLVVQSTLPDLDRGSGVNSNTESIALLGGGCTLP